MTTMSIKGFIRTASALPKNVSVLLRGDHGIGKSEVIRELAYELNFKPEDVIDRRLSQMSEGDILGLPELNEGSTRFCPPDWFMSACKDAKVVFLDELNRATPEVMQAAFQIVLDREMGGHKLHPDTRVYAAINTNAVYTVNEVDPALLDRFWTVDLKPTVEEWLEWAKSSKDGVDNVPYIVADFISHENKWLFTPKNTDNSAVSPSPRSWTRLGRALRHAELVEKPEDTQFYHLSLGFVGTEAAMALHTFAKSIDTRITGEEIVGYHKGKKFIGGYEKAKEKIARMGQERLNTAIDKVTEYITKECTRLTPEQGESLKGFIKDLPHELRVSAWTKLLAVGVEKKDLIKDIHGNVIDLILEVFELDKNNAGPGVMPKIPAMFQNQTPAQEKK